MTEYFKPAISQLDTYLIAVLLFSSLFFLCKVPAELFGWYACVLIYLLPCILLINLIFKEELNNGFVLVSAFIIASGAEHIAFFSFTAIAIILFSRPTISRKKKKQYIAFVSLTTFLFLFFIFSSGTFNRILFENAALTHSVTNSFSHLVNYQFSPYLIIGVLVLLVVYQLLPAFPLRNNLKQLTLITFAGYGVTFLFDFFIFSNAPNAQRIWFLTNMLNILWILLFIDLVLKKTSAIYLRSILLAICVVSLWIFFGIHVARLVTYFRKYDASVYAYQKFNLQQKLNTVPDPGITSSDFPDFSKDLYQKFFKTECSGK